MMESIINSFSNAVRMYPNKCGVRDKNGIYSYHMLDVHSNKIANFIIEECNNQGINIESNINKGKNGERIGIVMPRAKEFIVVLLGVIKAGCCITIINPSFPSERKNHIVNDAQCRFVISTSKLDTSDIEGEIFNFEDILEDNFSSKPIDLSKPDNEGIILYTSGTTGLSKGVVHPNKFIVSTVMDYWQDHYKFSSDDNSLCMAEFSFTVVLCELFTPIMRGGTIYILNEEERLNLSTIHDLIIKYSITCMFMPVKVLKYVADNFDDLNIKCIWSGGEKLPNIKKRDFMVIEIFGCSEAGFMISHLVSGDESPKIAGKPGPYWDAILIDENENPISEKSIIGELCIISEFLALRYLNLPKETNEKFIKCPFKKDSRMYKTGDLMSWTDDGFLKYHGRNDNMIKLNGMRVELSEVEFAVLEVENVSDAVCVVRNINGGENLVCFYSNETKVDDEKTFISQIEDIISKKLPEYMVPSFFVHLEKLPRNINGKINRKELPEVNIEKNEVEFEKARTELESLLVKGFSKILKINEENISINDNFYELGGNSVLTMELLDYLGVPEISSMDIFKGQSIKKIVKLVESKDLKNKEIFVAKENEEMMKFHSITPFQSRLISDQFCELNSTVWNIPFMFSLGTNIDAERFKSAVQKTINNHPALSVTFNINSKGEIKQHYVENLLPEVIIEEVSEEELQTIMPDLIIPFNIFGGPLSRFRIFKTESNLYFFIDVHHLLIDGTSSNIIYRDIVSAYNDKELLNDYYFSFIKDFEDMNHSIDFNESKEYYYDMYGDLSKWTLVPKEDLSGKGYNIDITGIWPTGLTVEDIEKAEEKFKTSRNVIAVYASLKALHQNSGNNKVLVNWVYNNRNNHIYDHTVGCLIKSLPVGLNMENLEDEDIILNDIKDQVINGIANSSYEYLSLNYESFKTDTLFINYLGALRNAEELQYFKPKTIDLPRKNDIAKMRMAIAVLESENGEILTGVEYCSSLYSQETAVKFHELLNDALISIVSNK